MKSLVYWMVFQIIIGLWLVFSPVVLGSKELNAMTANDMLLGGIVITLAIGMIVYDFYRDEDSEHLSDELHSGTHFKSS